MAILSKLDEPKFVKKLHGILTITWFFLAFPIMLFFPDSLPLLVFISVYAIVSGHWAGWDAAGGELEIEELKKTLARIESKL